MLAYQSDPRYQRFYPETDRTPEQAQTFVQMFLDNQAEQPRLKFQLALALKSDGRLIGNCGIRMRKPGAHEADIGYELNPEYWRQGYASDAARAIVTFGFSELDLHRVWSWCIADNVGSPRVLEKLGMRREGHLRENEFFKGRWWDTLMFTILEQEWQCQQRQ